MRYRTHWIIWLGIGVAPAAAFGQTAITYQGHLKQSGSPANGSFNMTFKLYDALAGGTQQGPTLTFDGVGGNPAAVAVASGLFTVSLDFGVAPYTANAARWLEIAVSGTTLTPRQSLSPAPFALNARGINVDAAGKVGIGTSTPAQKLSVAGTVQSTSGGFMFPDGTVQATASTSGTGLWTANGADIYNNNAGSVGLGTNSPTSMLDVRGNLTLEAGGSPGIFTGTGGAELNRYLTLINSPQLQSASGLKAGGVLVSDDYFYASPGKNDLIVKGRVGIKTGAPAYPLEIDGTSYGWVQTDGTHAVGSYVDATGGWLGTLYSHPLFFFTAGGYPQVTLNTAGELGIGTTSPSASLTVAGPNNIGQSSAAVEVSNTTASTGRRFLLGSSSSGLFQVADMTAGAATRMVINASGNVGIGTTTPAQKLDVNGTTRTKILEVTGADVAEKFPVSEKVEPGAVVEIDPDKPGQLRLSHQRYNRRVAGVVSGANGLNAGAILGNQPGNENAPSIALSGRVWVHCDSTGGAIEPGDLLTTSSTPGRAMKATDRERSHGAVIGKAMTRLNRGERGLVLVLVNLQ